VIELGLMELEERSKPATEDSARRPISSGGQALGNLIEERPLALFGTVVPLRTQVSALLEVHLRPAVPEGREDDGHELKWRRGR
jgi:hypothetical protein